MTYRVELKPEKQHMVEVAAARAGMAIEAYIAGAAESLAEGATAVDTVLDSKEARDADRRARIDSLRGRRAHLKGTVDDFLRERHAEAISEMNKAGA